MMRRRTAVAVLAGVLLAGLVAVPGAPAGAQDIADLPRLGYEIDPTQGFVGDDVHSQVNVDDVRDHCWSSTLVVDTDTVAEAVTSLEAEWSMYFIPGSWQGLLEVMPFLDPDRAEFFEALLDAVIARWGSFEPDQDIGLDIIEDIAAGSVEGIPDDADGQAFLNYVSAMFLTLTNPLATSQSMPIIYPQLHITTFVDPETQEMLGEMGNFDPDTGQGTMPVPELEPSLYAVAAACVFFVPWDELPAAFEAGLVAAWDWSVENDLFPTSTAQSGWEDWAAAGGLAAILGEIGAPQAIGIDFYCVLQDDGFCATPPGPVGLIDDDVLDEFNGDGPGDDPLAPGAEDLEGAGDLVAVQATPSFTG